jgi:hypothetical protein
MTDSIVASDKKLSYALLRAARTNAKIIKVLYLLKNRVAPEDKLLKDALDEATTQLEEQVDALNDAING